MNTRYLIFPLLFLFITSIVHSQEDIESHPLFDLLAQVPDTAAVHEGGMVVYADLQAAEAARGLAPLDDAGDWAALDDDGQRVWINAAPVYAMIPDMAMNFMSVAEDMPRLLGIDVFSIDRTLYFGQPPQMGYLLQGDFDPEAIAAAFDLRDYTAETQEDVMVLCPPDGCDSGMTVDPAAREPGNPFGGSLGRQEPMAFAPGYVFDSADYPTLQGIIAAATGEQPSLGDNSAYRTAAAAITAEGVLRQAMFVEPAVIFGDDPVALALGTRATAEEIETLREQYGLGEGYVPVGQAAALMVIADIAQVEDARQIGRITLVYENESVARSAADELTRRLSDDIPLLIDPGRTLQMVFEERGGALQPVRLAQDETTGQWALSFDVVGNLVQGDAQDDTGRSLMSGALGRQWVDMIYWRDLLWLA